MNKIIEEAEEFIIRTDRFETDPQEAIDVVRNLIKQIKLAEKVVDASMRLIDWEFIDEDNKIIDCNKALKEYEVIKNG